MSGDNVVPLKLVSIGDGVAINCDTVLEQAKGEFEEVLIIGINKEGHVDVRSSHGVKDAVWMAEAGKIVLMDLCFEP